MCFFYLFFHSVFHFRKFSSVSLPSFRRFCLTLILSHNVTNWSHSHPMSHEKLNVVSWCAVQHSIVRYFHEKFYDLHVVQITSWTMILTPKNKKKQSRSLSLSLCFCVSYFCDKQFIRISFLLNFTICTKLFFGGYHHGR